MNLWRRNGLVLTLAVVMTMGLCACGQNKNAAAEGKETSSNQILDYSQVVGYDNGYDDDYEDEYDEDVPECYQTDFKEQVIVDEDDYKVTVSRGDPSSSTYDLNFLLENKTDRDLTFEVVHSAVDGVMNSASMYESVTAGSKCVEEFCLDCLENYETSDISDIEIDLAIYYSDEYIEKSIYAERLEIYPSGEETPVNSYTRESQVGDQVILDDDVCTITYIGMDPNPDTGTGYLNFYVVNKSDSNINYYSEGLTVNDYMLDSADFGKIITKGKSYFDKSYLFESAMEDVGIELNDIDKIVIPLKVEALIGEDYTEVDSKTVTIEP